MKKIIANELIDFAPWLAMIFAFMMIKVDYSYLNSLFNIYLVLFAIMIGITICFLCKKETSGRAEIYANWVKASITSISFISWLYITKIGEQFKIDNLEYNLLMYIMILLLSLFLYHITYGNSSQKSICPSFCKK